MSIEIKTISPSDIAAWDGYVNSHPQATLYHVSGWKNIIEKTYGHKTYYLMAVKDNSPNATGNGQQTTHTAHSAVGILPLVHLKHFLFGNSLISIPFFDIGGILADDGETEKALLSEAIKLGHEIKASTIELRHIYPIKFFEKDSEADLIRAKESSQSCPPRSSRRWYRGKSCLKIHTATKSHKVRMLLELPESSEILMKSFKSKLRSQVKKPIKEGLAAKVGGLELLGDFYKVFSVEKSKFDKAIQYWQKLPVPVTKVVGPMIRKHIGL